VSDQAHGFDLIRAAGEVASSWQAALRAQAARLAVDADLLGRGADSYAATEAHNAALVGRR
jgi:hypothetical protein